MQGAFAARDVLSAECSHSSLRCNTPHATALLRGAVVVWPGDTSALAQVLQMKHHEHPRRSAANFRFKRHGKVFHDDSSTCVADVVTVSRWGVGA